MFRKRRDRSTKKPLGSGVRFDLAAAKLLADANGVESDELYLSFADLGRSCLAEDPSDSYLHIVIAGLLFRREVTFGEAMLHLAVGLREKPQDPAGLRLLAKALYSKGFMNESNKYAELSWKVMELKKGSYNGNLEELHDKWLDLAASRVETRAGES